MRKEVARLTRNLNEMKKTFAEEVRAILERFAQECWKGAGAEAEDRG